MGSAKNIAPMGTSMQSESPMDNISPSPMSAPMSNNNYNYAPYEHKQNESVDSSISAQSAQSYNNNYNNNFNYNQPQSQPPSAYSAYNNANKQPMPKRTRQLSEGMGPQTGAPEVVGDISSWKAQQAQNEIAEQKYQQQNAYPNLHDGVPQTGADPNLRLNQSRTSVSGQQIMQQHQQYDNNYNPLLQQQNVGNNNGNEIIPSSISAYNPNAPPLEESSSSDDDLNDLVNGNAFKQPKEATPELIAPSEHKKEDENQKGIAIERNEDKQKQKDENEESE